MLNDEEQRKVNRVNRIKQMTLDKDFNAKIMQDPEGSDWLKME